MTGSTYTALETQYGELAGVVASQWGEDVMATMDVKLHMTDDTNVQTVQGPLNFSTTSVNTFAGQMNFSTTSVNTFAGPVNFSTTATHTWAGPVDFNSSGNMQGAMSFQTHVYLGNGSTYYIDQVGTPNFNQMNVANAVTFGGAIDANSTMNLQGLATFQTGATFGDTTTFSGDIDLNSTLNVSGIATFQTTMYVGNLYNSTYTNKGFNFTSTDWYTYFSPSSVATHPGFVFRSGTDADDDPRFAHDGSGNHGLLGTPSAPWYELYCYWNRSAQWRAPSHVYKRIEIDPGINIIKIHPAESDITSDWFEFSVYDDGPSDSNFISNAFEHGRVGHGTTPWYQVYAKEVYDDDGTLGTYDEHDDLALIDAIKPWKKDGEIQRDKDNNPLVDYTTIPDFLKGYKYGRKIIKHTDEHDETEDLEVEDRDNIIKRKYIRTSLLTMFTLGGVKQLHNKFKDFSNRTLDAVEDIQARLDKLERTP